MEKESREVSQLLPVALELAGLQPIYKILKIKEWIVFRNEKFRKKIIREAVSRSKEMEDLYQDMRCVIGEEAAELEMIELLRYKLKDGSLTLTLTKA